MFFPSPAYRPGVKNACWEVSQTLCILEGFTLLEKRKGSGAMAERKRAIQLKYYVTEQERILIEEKMKLLQTDNLGAYLPLQGQRRLCRKALGDNDHMDKISGAVRPGP